MKPLTDMLGQRVGRLVVVARAENGDHGAARWRCRCDCGGETVTYGKSLRRGVVNSCGCWRKERASKMGRSNLTHGASFSPEYGALHNAIDRCHNPNCRGYKNYGARGIRVADEWRTDRGAFLEHVGSKPSSKHTLERVDNDKGYEPGNVRWATRGDQANNRRTNHIVEFQGRSMTLAEAVTLSGLRRSTVSERIRHGWPVEKALTWPNSRLTLKNS